MGPCELVFTAHLSVVTAHGVRGIAGQREGAETCVWTFGKDGGSMEWTATRSLVTCEDGGGQLTGRWVAIDDDARITIAKGLDVTGDTVWHGYGDNTHLGAIHGRGHLEHDILTVDDNDDSECELRARRVGRYLVVVDSHRCGGVNVAFDGVYRRK